MTMIPTVHINGTSKSELLGQVLKVLDAIRDLEKALSEMSPHGRDYYPQGHGAIYQAQEEHRQRFAKLEAIKKSVEEVGLAL